MKFGRITGVISLFLAAMLLTGCQKQQPNPAAQAAEFYQGLDSFSAIMQLQTDSGVIMTYKLAAEWTRQGSEVTVLEPEEIAGVRCQVLEQGARLLYDGVELETLLPGLPGFTPVSCLDGLLDSLANGAPTEWAWEQKQGQDCLALTYELELEGIQTTRQIWLEKETLSPLCAEWYLEGDQVMSAVFLGE